MIINETKLIKRLEEYLISQQTKLCDEMVNGLNYEQYQRHVASARTLQGVREEIEAIRKDLAEER